MAYCNTMSKQSPRCPMGCQAFTELPASIYARAARLDLLVKSGTIVISCAHTGAA